MLAQPRIRHVVTAAGGVALAGVLAACGGSSGAVTTSQSPAAASSASSAPSGAGTGNRGPAASGLIAAISGTTMQVQNQQTGQVAVSWTAKTAFTHQVPVPTSALAVGACVTAVGAAPTSGSASAPASSAPFAATTVTVTAARNGSCQGGFGGGGAGGGGARPSGFPTGSRPNLPSGARPSGFPTGARRSGFPGGFGNFASGKVTAVSASTVTVSSQRPGSTSSTTRTFTVGSSTQLRTNAATTAKSLAVGLCVSAQGTADSSGAVAATRVEITSPVNGACTAGFGRVRSGG